MRRMNTFSTICCNPESPCPPTLGGVLDGFSRFPPGPHLGGSRFSRLPPLCKTSQNDEKFGWCPWRPGPQAPGGPGPKPWAPSPCVGPGKPASCTLDFLRTVPPKNIVPVIVISEDSASRVRSITVRSPPEAVRLPSLAAAAEDSASIRDLGRAPRSGWRCRSARRSASFIHEAQGRVPPVT